jgi:hypothetical protein
MAEQIKCPICGEMNAPELELCTNCRSPLQPKSNIPSGQNPTKKHTAELEPILPQWLREARDAARNTEPEDSLDYLQTTENKPKPAASQPDLLAGLQSQTSDDEEEVPDWLASITGASPKSRPAKDEPATDVRWVEMGEKDDFAQSENILAQPPSRGGQDDEVPAWLAGLQNQSAPEKDELTDWLSDQDDEPAKEEPFTFTPTQDETPDWLKQMSADAESKSQQVSSQPTRDAQFDVDTPDWLKQMSANAEPVEAKTPQDAPEFNIDTPDWLSSLGGASENALGVEPAAFTESSLPEKEAESLPPMDMPDWLKSSSEVKDEKSSQDTTTPLWLKPQVQSQEPEMPAWLSSSEETVYLDQQKEEPPVQDNLLGDVPDWLKAAAPEKTIFDSQDELKSEVDSAETPDWFSSIQPSGETEIEEKAEPEKADPFASMPAFTLDSQSEENLDGLFTEMPDWLSSASEPPSSSTPTPITNEDILPSNDLPSWVEAMRPSDSGLSQLTSSASDQTLESRGALAGLQGVLPAVPGFTPTSKPKAYSLKLNANDEQLRHAGILEDILAAETSPVPIESFSTLMPSRSLRWTLAFLMLVVVFSTTFLRTQIFALPRGVPNEVSAAIQVMQSIPENAAVLVAFDYEPSRAGEMEAAATPLLDQLLLLKRARFTLIATNETGSVLAERFISGPLAFHQQSGMQYTNLGYLPGGQLGIRAFAQNPSVTSPFDIFGQPAWASPTLQGVTALNQFTAMILITDNADAARVWVEQTQGLRGTIPFIVVSSSQATPMIQPYYDSAQVTGIVPGLYGGAIFEQYNAGRPGTARNYWDAYSIGMLMAMALVLGGGLWNLGVGLRERREAK